MVRISSVQVSTDWACKDKNDGIMILDDSIESFIDR